MIFRNGGPRRIAAGAVLLLLAALAAGPQPARAETFVLKNGTEVKGKPTFVFQNMAGLIEEESGAVRTLLAGDVETVVTAREARLTFAEYYEAWKKEAPPPPSPKPTAKPTKTGPTPTAPAAGTPTAKPSRPATTEEQTLSAIFGGTAVDHRTLSTVAQEVEKEPGRYLPPLLGLLRAADTNTRTLYWVIKILGRLKVDRARPDLIARAGHPTAADVRAASVEALAAFERAEDIPLFKKALLDGEGTVRTEAIKGLKPFAAAQPEVRLIFFQFMSDGNYLVRAVVFDTLQQIPDLVLTPEQRGLVYETLKHENPDVRRPAAGLLAGQGDAESLKRLAELVADKDRKIRCLVVVALAGKKDKLYSQALGQAFFDREEARNRKLAIETIVALGDKRAVGQLIECLALPPQARQTRQQAWEALKKLTGRNTPLSYAQWKAWWEAEAFKETFESSPGRGTPPATARPSATPGKAE